ncbi:MAG TPA: hypothetical protein VK146_14885 [Tabrizicola sp.]|nr:hypothetical protein [Tabrizicola sp.]
MSGHSLTDPIPQPLEVMVRAGGGKDALGMLIDKSTIPGSPMDWRWNHDMELEISARRDIANYQLLVLTERVTVLATILSHNSPEMALSWVRHAWEQGNGGKGAATVLYASWIDLKSGPDKDIEGNDTEEGLLPFRERLDVEMGHWEEILAHVNANLPAGCPVVPMIPGPKVMAAVYDAIAAGNAPGLSRMEELFEDEIHVNAKGAFLIALAHYAVIYGQDPREIPVLRGEPGWPSSEQQDWMKALVWDVCRAYGGSGLA